MNKTTEPITIGRLGLAHEEVRGLIKKTKATLTRIRLNRRFRLTTPGIKYVYTIQFLLSALEEELDEVLKQRVGELDKAYRLKPVDQDKTD